MKAKVGLLVISVLAVAVSISPLAFAQGGPYGRTRVSAASASTKEQGNSAEAARESAADATSKVKEGNDYRKARAELNDSRLTAKAKAALGKDEQTRSSAIQIATANGIMVLSGRVDSKAVAERAQAIVVRLKGVKDVHNELTYRASSDDKATLPSANRR